MTTADLRAGQASQPVSVRRSGWRDYRDRLLSSPRFQRWALGFRLTRPIARRQQRALFDLCAGFVYSQILLACVELRLFDLLATGALPLDTLASRLGLADEPARILLDGARAIRLVERRRDGRYGLGSLGAALHGNPGVAAMIEHHRMLYADLADPVALLRGEPASRRLADYWAYAGQGAAAELPTGATAAYTALMSASQAMIAGEILDAYPIARHTGLIDIGGGDGSFLEAVAARAPDLHLMLFDLPSVAAIARDRLDRVGLTHRVSIHAGDFRADSLPAGADAASLVRILHDHDDEVASTILRAVRHCLPAGGTVLVAEPMAETAGAEPVGHAYFGWYLKALGSGRPRSAAELSGLLKTAGFPRVKNVPTRSPMLTALLVAQ